jgi:hypothetical protein
MTSSRTAVAIVQLAVYIILLPLILYLLYSHGKRGILGYLYLFLFCTLQIISGGLQIANPTSTTAAILSSVGLSPLLLGLAGLLHEAHTYLSPQNTIKAKLGWAFQLLLHMVTIAAIVLIAIGTADLSDDVGTSKYHKDLTHRKVGSVLLLLAFLAILAHAAWVFLNYRSVRNTLAKKLLYSTIPALPVIFARLIYTLVYSFASPNSHTFRALSPATASVAIRVIFIFLLPLLAVLSLIVGGIVSRQLPRSAGGRIQSDKGYRGNDELQNFGHK